MLAEIGNRLKYLRKNNNFSQKEIAGKLFISQAAYSLIETAQNGVISEHLIRLSEIYEVTTDFILKGNTKLIEADVKNGFLPFVTTAAHSLFRQQVGNNQFSEEYDYYRIPGYHPTKESFLIEISGNNMPAAITSGDILICQTQKHLDRVLDGSLVVMVTKNDLVARRVFQHENSLYFWTEEEQLVDRKREKIKKLDIFQLLIIQGKASTLLIPEGKSEKKEYGGFKKAWSH